MKLLLITLCLLQSTLSLAYCTSEWVCDDNGLNCSTRQVCDSTLDTPSVYGAGLKPLPSVELKPLPSMALPPIGSHSCQFKQVAGTWQNVCE